MCKRPCEWPSCFSASATFLLSPLAARSSPAQKLPAVHANDLSGYVRGTRPAQKQNGCGNITRFENGSQEALGERCVFHHLRYDFGQRSTHPPGFNHVD